MIGPPRVTGPGFGPGGVVSGGEQSRSPTCSTAGEYPPHRTRLSRAKFWRQKFWGPPVSATPPRCLEAHRAWLTDNRWARIAGLRGSATRRRERGTGYVGRRAVRGGRPLRSRHGGTLGRAQAEMGQDFLNDPRLLDEREDAHWSRAPRANQAESPTQTRRSSKTSSRSRRFPLPMCPHLVIM